MAESKAEALLGIVEYLYTNELSIKKSRLRDVIVCVRELELNEPLIEQIAASILKNAKSMNDYLEALDAAVQLEHKVLYEHFLDKIRPNFNQAIISNAFAKLSPMCVYELLSTKVEDRNEKLLLSRTLMWANTNESFLNRHGERYRRKFISRLLKKINFKKINMNEFYTEFYSILKSFTEIFYSDSE